MKKNLISINKQNKHEALRLATEILRSDGVIIYPTDTFYALGANPFSPVAVKKIFKIKNRPSSNPVGVCAGSYDDLYRLTPFQRMPEHVKYITSKFWPGPLSILLEKSPSVPDLLTAGADTVACRIPGSPVALELLLAVGMPLTATSANPAGGSDPGCVQDIHLKLLKSVDLVLDFGPAPGGAVSTIISFDGTEPVLCRKGAVDIDAIKNAAAGK